MSFKLRIFLFGVAAALAVALPPAARSSTPARVVRITVDGPGFRPARTQLAVNQPVRLVFHRTSAPTCITGVKIPALHVPPTPLAVGKDITIAVRPTRSGRFPFTCAMGMVKGELIIH